MPKCDFNKVALNVMWGNSRRFKLDRCNTNISIKNSVETRIRNKNNNCFIAVACNIKCYVVQYLYKRNSV